MPKLQPKLALLPEGQRGGTRFLECEFEEGANGGGSHRQGHFQDQARQLTSSASGRAILRDPARAGLSDLPNLNQVISRPSTVRLFGAARACPPTSAANHARVNAGSAQHRVERG